MFSYNEELSKYIDSSLNIKFKKYVKEPYITYSWNSKLTEGPVILDIIDYESYIIIHFGAKEIIYSEDIDDSLQKSRITSAKYVKFKKIKIYKEVDNLKDAIKIVSFILNKYSRFL